MDTNAVARGQNVLPAVLTASLFTRIVASPLESGKAVPDSAIKLTNRESRSST